MLFSLLSRASVHDGKEQCALASFLIMALKAHGVFDPDQHEGHFYYSRRATGLRGPEVVLEQPRLSNV